jgi:flavodoxin
MNKKILALLGIFAIVMIGCAYAADSADSLNNTLTISGMNFTIPEGMTEDIAEEVVNETGADENYTFVTNSKTLEDDENVVIITVATYDQNLTEDYINDIGEKTTINNITGYLEDQSFFALFSYIQDNDLVIVTANDKNLIEEVLS